MIDHFITYCPNSIYTLYHVGQTTFRLSVFQIQLYQFFGVTNSELSHSQHNVWTANNLWKVSQKEKGIDKATFDKHKLRFNFVVTLLQPKLSLSLQVGRYSLAMVRANHGAVAADDLSSDLSRYTSTDPNSTLSCHAAWTGLNTSELNYTDFVHNLFFWFGPTDSCQSIMICLRRFVNLGLRVRTLL